MVSVTARSTSWGIGGTSGGHAVSESTTPGGRFNCFLGVSMRFNGFKGDGVTGLSNGIAGLSNGIAGLFNGIAGLSNGIAGLSNRIAGLSNGFEESGEGISLLSFLSRCTGRT